MKHDTVENVLANIVGQQFIPRTMIYSNSDRGRIEVVVYNVQGDWGKNCPGQPSARFEAFKREYSNVEKAYPTFETTGKVFETLAEALDYIGVY